MMPVYVTHINSRYLKNGGAEVFLRDLPQYFSPAIAIRQSICTNHVDFDLEFTKTFPFPVKIGGKKDIQSAIAAGDVLLIWGNPQLNNVLGLTDRPEVCIYNAAAENVAQIQACSNFITHIIASNTNVIKLLNGKYPCTLIHPGVDPKRVKVTKERKEMRTDLGFSDDDFVVGMVSRIDNQKRQSWLVNCMQKLPGIKALFVGDGPEFSKLSSTANYQCLFVGHQEKEIGNWINCLDAMCNLSSTEGCAAVIFEAMLLKVPLILTPVGASPDFLTNNSAIFVNTQDELVSAVQKLALDKELRTKLASNAQEIANRIGHISKTAERWEELILRLRTGKGQKKWKLFM